MAEHQEAPWYHIDRKLLPVKLSLFCSYAAAASLLPYLSVYMKQLGLTSRETGLIYGIMPFLTFFTIPLFGAIADKTRRHKWVLIFCFLFSGGCYMLLLKVVPSANTDQVAKLSFNARLHCQPDDIYFEELQFGNSSAALCDDSLDNLTAQPREAQTFYEISCKVENTTTTAIAEVCFTGGYVLETCFAVIPLSVKDMDTNGKYSVNMTGNMFRFYTHGLASYNKILTNRKDVEHQCQRFEITGNISFLAQSFAHFYCPSKTTFLCAVARNGSNQGLYGDGATGADTWKTFWWVLALFLVSSVFATPIPSMLDNLSCSVLKKGQIVVWGKQRLCGTLGYLALAPVSASIMEKASMSYTEVDYAPAFYIFLGLSVVSAVITGTINYSGAGTNGSFWKHFCKPFKKPEIVVFLVLMMFFGMFKSVPEVFLFWRLKNLNAGQLVLGLVIVCNSVPEIIVLYCAGPIIKRLGHSVCLCIALIAFVLRFIAYSLITNPWHVLFVEPLHGLTFALMQSAATTYVIVKTPEKDSEDSEDSKEPAGTLQGLRGGFHSGLGKGIGGVVTGYLFDPVSGLGEVWTFRIYAIMSFAVLLLYAIVQCVCFKEPHTDKTSTSATAENQGEGEADRPLMPGEFEVRFTLDQPSSAEITPDS